MKGALFPADVVFVAYHGILSILVVAAWNRLAQPGLFLGFHALALGIIAAVAWLDARRPHRATRFVHCWLPAVLVLSAYRELHWLIPQIHPFADRRFDWALLSIDQSLFGDVEGFCRSIAWGPAADVLYVFYVAFYVLPFAYFGALYAKGKTAEFRDSAAIVFACWCLSYLGYIAVPALGPHLVTDATRATEFGGVVWGTAVYRTLLSMELETADAFPSGHVMVTLTLLWCSWRYLRGAFWWMLTAAVGISISLVYLRYHYVTDVLVGAALVPPSIWLGRAVSRAMEPIHNPQSRIQNLSETGTQ